MGNWRLDLFPELLDKNGISQSSADARFLKLDQSIQQTTVGTFKFPSTDVTGDSILKGSTYLNLDSGRQHLNDWDAQLSKAQVGAAATKATAVVAFIGDSWTWNQGITRPITQYLQTQFGYNGSGYISAMYAQPTPDGLTRATAGTWTERTSFYGASISYAFSTDTATPATKTFTGQAENMVIHYVKQPNGGTFTYRVTNQAGAEEVAATAVDTSNATEEMGFVTISSLNTGYFHTLTLTVTSAGTAGVALCGVDFQYSFNGTQSGVRVHNLGFTGSKVSDWITYDATMWQDTLEALDPNLVVIMLGVNDEIANVTPAAYASNLETLIDRVQAATPTASIILSSPSDILNSYTYPMSDYVDAMRTVAYTNHLGFIDNYKLLGDYATANARGLYTNSTHLSSAGDNLVANHFIAYLAQPFPINTNSLISNRLYLSLSIGSNGLVTTTTGYANLGVGASTLYANTEGSYNTALGWAALNANTTGSSNVALSYNALLKNTIGQNNTAVGTQALKANTYGDYSVAVGENALVKSTSLGYNTAVGTEAMSENLGGYFNVAMGYQTLYTNSSGLNNTMIGMQAAYGPNSSNSAVVGFEAMFSGTTLANCAVIGYKAGFSNTTSSGLTLLGYQAGYDLTSATNSIIIGQNVTAPSATSAAVLNIGNVIYGTGMYAGATVSSTPTATGKIGIGTSTPDQKLAVLSTISEPSIVGSANATAKFGAENSSALVIANGGAVSSYGTSLQVRDNNSAINAVYDLLLQPLGGNVGIGTTTPTSKLAVSNDLTTGPDSTVHSQLEITGATDPTYRLALGYNTTGNYGLISAMKTNSAFTNLVLNEYGGKVGIGTANPSTPLDVKGMITTRSASPDDPSAPAEGLRMAYSDSDTTTLYANSIFNEVSSIANTGLMQFRVNNGASTQATVMSLTGGGKVGIGTNNPSRTLEVTTASVAGAGSVQLSSDTYGGYVSSVAGSNAGVLYLNPSNNNVNILGGVGMASAGILNIFSGSTYTISLNGNGTSYLNGGKFGIGTTEPSQLFSVGGSAYIKDSLNIGNTSVDNAGTDGGIYFSRSSTNEPFLHFSNGNGASPLAQVRGINGGGLRFTDGASAVEWARFDATGHFGINTTAPDALLHVNGGISGPHTKTLTNNSATTLFTVTLGDGAHAGGQIFYTIKVTGTDGIQTHTGVVTWSANRTGTTYTTAINEAAQLESPALSAGTLTDTWAMTSGSGVAAVTLNANSNRAGITVEQIDYTVIRNSTNAITYA